MAVAPAAWPVPIIWFTTVGTVVADIRKSQVETTIPRLADIWIEAPLALAHLENTTDPKVAAVQTTASAISLYQTEVLSAGIVDIRDRVVGVSSFQTEVLAAGVVDIRDRVADVSLHQTEVLAAGVAQVLEDVAASYQLLVTGVVPLINQVLGVVTPTRQLLQGTVLPVLTEVALSLQLIRWRLEQEVVPTTEEILAVVTPTRQALEETVVPGIAEVLGGVESTQQILVQEVVPAAEEVLGVVIPTRQVLEGHVVPGIAQALVGIQSTQQLLVQEVAPTTAEILGVVIPTHQVLVGNVVPGIVQVLDGVQSTQTVIAETVVPVTQEILNVVTPTQQVLVETVAPNVAAILNLVTPVHQVLVGTVVPGIAQVWQGIVTLNSGLHELATWMPPLMPGPTAPPIAALGLQLAEAIDGLFPGKPKTVGDRAEDALATFKDRILGWFEDFKALPGQYLNFVADRAGTDLALNPARAFDTLGELYTLSIGAGTAAHLVSTVVNLIPTLNWVGASQFAAFIAEAAGFEPITKASYGVLLNQCIAWPLQYYWNEKLRPKIPTEGAIYAMGRKRGLNRSEFGQAMAYHGLPETWIDKEYAFFWADPSPYWLLRMSEHSTPAMSPSEPMRRWLDEWIPNWRSDPWSWFRMKLMLAGFEDTDIQPFIDGFRSRRAGPAITQVKTSVRAMIREAYWDRTQAKAALKPLGVREEEIEYMILAEEIDYQNRYNDGQVLYLNESFRKGEISAQDLSLVLNTIIVKPERVAQIVAREQVRALPKPKSVVPAKEDPRVKSLVTQAVGSWTKGYRAWEVEEEELEIGLAIVLQDPVLAHQMVLAERTRYRPEPPPPKPPVEDPLIRKSRVAAIASWVTQFREGKITAAVMELGLANLIVDPDITRLIRQIEELRAVPAPDILPPWEEDPTVAAVREETVRGHLEMFRKRIIDIDELYTYLLADGLVEPLARSTALTQALKRIKTPPLEAPYFERDRLRDLIDEAIDSYTRMLELGQITMPEFEAYLAGVGVDPDVITYLGDTQQVRRFIQAAT